MQQDRRNAPHRETPGWQHHGGGAGGSLGSGGGADGELPGEQNPLEAPLDPLSRKVIGCAIEVHRRLGPGLLESSYEECLCYELRQAGLRFERQMSLPVVYKSIRLDCGYRIDLMVEGVLVVELKTVDAILPVHRAQLLTYLKLTGFHTGLLLNFHVAVLRDGIRRMVL
jgi:GxxExxY protein